MVQVTNLQDVWAVQECSGVDSTLFTSYEEAESQRNAWIAECEELFMRFMRGEPGNDALVTSSIEPNLNGGCNIVFSVSDHALPSNIKHFKIGELEFELWEMNPGSENIRWGNIATERYRK